MTKKFYNDAGELEFELADSVMELPWFVEVVKKSEEYLDMVYRTNPDACSSWYLQYREGLADE